MPRRAEYLRQIDEALEDRAYERARPELERAAAEAADKLEREEMMQRTRLIRLLDRIGEPVDTVRGQQISKREKELILASHTLAEARCIASDEEDWDEIKKGELVMN